MANRQIRQNPTNRNLPELDSSEGAMPFTNSRGVKKPDILSSSTPSDIDRVLEENGEILDALKQASQISAEDIGGASSDMGYNPVDDYARESYGLSPKPNDSGPKASSKFKPTIGSPVTSGSSQGPSSSGAGQSGPNSSAARNESKSLSDIIKNDRLSMMAGLQADADNLKRQKVSRFNIRGRARKRAKLIALSVLVAFAAAVPIGVIGVIPHAIQNWIGNRVGDYAERASEKVGQRMLYSYLKNRVAIEKCNDYYNNVVNVNPAAASALGKSACRPRMGEREGRVKQLFDDWKGANMEDLLAKNGIAIEYNADSTSGGDRTRPYSISYATSDGKREDLRLTDDLTSVDWDQGKFLGRRTASIDFRKAINKTLKEETNWWQYLKRRNLKAGYLRNLDLPARVYTPRSVAEKRDNLEAYKDVKVSRFKQNLVKHVINNGDGRIGAFIEILLEGNGKNKLSKNELEGTIKRLRKESSSLSDAKIAQMVKKYAGKDLTKISLEVTAELVNKLLKKIGLQVGEESVELATKAIPIIGQVMLAFMILDLLDLATDGTLQKYLSITNAQSMLEISNLLDTITSEEKRGFVDAESAGDMRLNLISGLASSRVFANTVGYTSPSGKKAAGYNCKPKMSISDLNSLFDQVGNIFTAGDASSGEQTGMADDQDTCENHRVDYDPLNSFSFLFGFAQSGLKSYTEDCVVQPIPGLDIGGAIDDFFPGDDYCPSAQQVYHGVNGGISWLFQKLGLETITNWFANLPPFKFLAEKSAQYFANAFSIAITGSSLAGKELLQGGISGEAKTGAKLFDGWSGGQQVMMNEFSKGVGEGGGLGAPALSSGQAAKLNKTIAAERKEDLKTASIYERFFDLSEPDTLVSSTLVTVLNEGGYQNYVNPLNNIATLFKSSSTATYASSPEQEYCSDVDQFGRAVTEFGVTCYGIGDEAIDSMTDEQLETYGDPEFCESFSSEINERNSQKESESYYTVDGDFNSGRNPNQESNGSAINTDFDPCRLICTATDTLGTFARTDDPICGFESISPTGSNSTATPSLVAGLESPPNLGPDLGGGYYRMPEAPNGEYSFNGGSPEPQRCGSKQLVDTIYTVSKRWYAKYPSSKVMVWDLNAEGHQSHNIGIDVDLNTVDQSAGVTSGDPEKSKELARMFADTGIIQKILYNDTSVQDDFNSYVEQNNLKGVMESYPGHDGHFHLRISSEFALAERRSCP